ncbi:hypothetical protein [Mucilaginibacter sp. SJ]|uniref:hypothetical protein n=1 Tax=Mucilaginibacter sp. SJ TaxID=3029053 RepID=UPI0023A99948|nr:hypothetical protein [Mucilaginibacter sp. SJ]WEA00732.1 hypothetical protein MusilaSJ_25080 [Mucilaginibacter sp. SJ]
MSGIVVDLKDFNVRTPDQVLRVFFSKYPADEVKVSLWKAMSVMAGNPKFTTQQTLAADDAADLFDHLIALVEALDDLIDEPPSRCPICKREKESGDGIAG